MPVNPPPLDFAARIAQRRAMAEAYRARAQTTGDELLRKVYSGLAATYENMARVIEQAALRIESIESTTAKAREKIVAAEPRETDDPSATAYAASTRMSRMPPRRDY
jgi:hypothetical protein